MNYEVAESREFPGHWHAESIQKDGSILVVVFSGEGAAWRAREYALWKNGNKT